MCASDASRARLLACLALVLARKCAPPQHPANLLPPARPLSRAISRATSWAGVPDMNSREARVQAKPSYSQCYTALNAVAGHYNSFGTSPAREHSAAPSAHLFRPRQRPGWLRVLPRGTTETRGPRARARALIASPCERMSPARASIRARANANANASACAHPIHIAHGLTRLRADTPPHPTRLRPQNLTTHTRPRAIPQVPSTLCRPSGCSA